MPQKNSVKIYYEDGFYHVYNRGVEKREIFSGRDDYLTFLNLLKTALSPEPPGSAGLHPAETSTKNPTRLRKNFSQNINLIAYCLMPNHYHMLVQQKESSALTQFIRSISTAYSMYFNKKHQRVGSLFQGIFKAIDISDEPYFIWVSRYIHRNPPDFASYPYSSYLDYLGSRHSDWLKTTALLEIFNSNTKPGMESYQDFVEGQKDYPIDLSSFLIETYEGH